MSELVEIIWDSEEKFIPDFGRAIKGSSIKVSKQLAEKFVAQKEAMNVPSKKTTKETKE